MSAKKCLWIMILTLGVAQGCGDEDEPGGAEPEATPEGEPEGGPEGDPEGEPGSEPEAAPEATPEAAPEGDPEGEPEGEPEGLDELPPTEGAALEAWLEAGIYKAWPAESEVHGSTGPHFGDVRTYINPTLEGSLQGGLAQHPEGSATVKELFGRGGQDTVLGWSVMRKVSGESAGGQGWFWFEVYNGNTFGEGVGVGICVGCHGGGQDFFLTPFPLR